MTTNNIYIRLRQECNQAVLSDSHDLIISALGAALIVQECPWFAVHPWNVRAAVWLGYTICLLFFCLFCEKQAEKWEKYLEERETARAIDERRRWIRWLGSLHGRRTG